MKAEKQNQFFKTCLDFKYDFLFLTFILHTYNKINNKFHNVISKLAKTSLTLS